MVACVNHTRSSCSQARRRLRRLLSNPENQDDDAQSSPTSLSCFACNSWFADGHQLTRHFLFCSQALQEDIDRIGRKMSESDIKRELEKSLHVREY